MLSSEVILDGHFFVRLLAEAESSVEASFLTCRGAIALPMSLRHQPPPQGILMRFIVHK